MCGFTGFRREHFDYFLLHDDKHARPWIRGQMTCFATQLQRKLQPIVRFYERHKVGTLKLSDPYCWVAFGPTNPANIGNVTHRRSNFGPTAFECL